MSNPASTGHGIPETLAGQVLSIKSSDLFQVARSVCIEHAGQVYILRLTKENKLILTK